MYSVAFESTVALFSFGCGSLRELDGGVSMPLCSAGDMETELDLDEDLEDLPAASAARRREGTESRNAVILSLRLVRYRFSIMLCAVFFGACRREDGGGEDEDSSSSSDADECLCLREGSGDEDGEAYWV